MGWVRSQFPALASDTLHFDNAAGAQVPQPVLDWMHTAMTEYQVNKGGAYRESVRVGEVKEGVRAQVAQLLNAPEPASVSFGPNATTLITLLAGGLRRAIEPGDEIVVTELDHHANVDPWRRLAEAGAEIRTWRTVGDECRLDVDDLRALVSERTRLVAVTAASNALGTITDVAEAAHVAHEAGAWLMVDAVHYAPHRMPDVQAWNADVCVFSPYKVFGPHLGVLYLSPEVAPQWPAPALSFFPETGPIRWETGTQNHEAIAGLAGTFEYLDAVSGKLGAPAGREGWERVFGAFHQHETELSARLLDGLARLGATRYGLQTAEGRTSTVSMNLDGTSPDAVARHLASDGIAVAHGHYYAWELMMNRLGLADRGGAVRISAVHYNTIDEIDRVIESLARLDRG